MGQTVQSLDGNRWRVLELNGGRVSLGAACRFHLSPVASGYADAQIDDIDGRGGFRWGAGTTLSLRARFSHAAGELLGTAGFGFWNAAYGDPSRRRPPLPRAAWFFYGSAPNDLPFAPGSPGRGWFAATLDASTPAALALAPLAPAVLLLNQFTAARRRLWPAVRQKLGIHAAPIDVDMTAWRAYRLEWSAAGVRFLVDDRLVLESPQAPRGPLGFVCWLDNQYLALSPRGRFRAGVLGLRAEQWLEVSDLRLEMAVDKVSASS